MTRGFAVLGCRPGEYEKHASRVRTVKPALVKMQQPGPATTPPRPLSAPLPSQLSDRGSSRSSTPPQSPIPSASRTVIDAASSPGALIRITSPDRHQASSPFKKGCIRTRPASAAAATQLNPREDLEALFHAVRDGADPGQAVRGSQPARRFLSAPFSNQVCEHLGGRRLPGTKQPVDAMSRLLYHPKTITVPGRTSEQRRSRSQHARERAAAVVIQRMVRRREAEKFVQEKRRWTHQMQALVVMTVDTCELAIWFQYWKSRKEDAVLLIQQIARGRRGRYLAAQKERIRQEREACARAIQRRARGMAVRGEVNALRASKEASAIRLQALGRGYLGRARVQRQRLVQYLTDAADPELQKRVVAGEVQSNTASQQLLSTTVQQFLTRAEELEQDNTAAQDAPSVLTVQMIEKRVAHKYEALVVNLAAQVRELQAQLVLERARGAHGSKAPDPEVAAAAEEPAWFQGTPSEEPTEETLEPVGEEAAQEAAKDAADGPVNLQEVRLLPDQVPTTKWAAAVLIQSVLRTSGWRERCKREARAAGVLARALRRFLVRRRLRMQFGEVEKEALQISRDRMLECEKVLHTGKFFEQAPNQAVEKWRLVKSLVASKAVVRSLFVHYSSTGLTDATVAFRVSQLQWLSLCTEGSLCQNFDHRIPMFQQVFETANQGTDPYIPLDVINEPSHMVLCEFVQALLEIAHIWFPSQRGRISDSWRELVTSALKPLMLQTQLDSVKASPGFAIDEATGEQFRAMDGWAVLPDRFKQDAAMVYRVFASIQQFDMEGESMNVEEFMNMFSSLELIDANLKLQMCVSIFVRCNQIEMNHFLGTAISGYKLEERLQMSWEEFVDALLECAMLKYAHTDPSPAEAFGKFVSSLSSGWNRYKALQVLRKGRENEKKRWKNLMCTNGVHLVEPLKEGSRRIVLPAAQLPSTVPSA